MRPISRSCPTPRRCPGLFSMGRPPKPYSTPDRTRCTTSRRKSRNPGHSWKTSERPRPTRRKPRNARSNRPSVPRARAKRVDFQPTKPTAPPRRKRRPAISRSSSSPLGTAGSTKGAKPPWGLLRLRQLVCRSSPSWKRGSNRRSPKSPCISSCLFSIFSSGCPSGMRWRRWCTSCTTPYTGNTPCGCPGRN